MVDVVGDHVGAGQKLATIDSAQAEKQLQVAKDNLAVAQENLTNAENTPAPNGQAQSTTSLQAKVDQAELDVQNAQDAVNGTVLTAPGAGPVTAVNGVVGQQSSTGSSSNRSSA